MTTPAYRYKFAELCRTADAAYHAQYENRFAFRRQAAKVFLGVALGSIFILFVVKLVIGTDVHEYNDSANIASVAMNERFKRCCSSNELDYGFSKHCNYETSVKSLRNAFIYHDFKKENMNVFVTCAADGYDNSACCRDSNVPELCLDGCDGTPIKLTIALFKCMKHFEQRQGEIFSSAIGLIFPFTLIFRLAVEMIAPSYKYKFTELRTTADEEAGTEHLVHHQEKTTVRKCVRISLGVGLISIFVFFLVKLTLQIEHDTDDQCNNVNVTTVAMDEKFKLCCEIDQLDIGFSELCRYDVHTKSLKHAFLHNGFKKENINVLVECAADGKNNTLCCAENGVPEHCIRSCAGLPLKIDMSLLKCVKHFGQVMKCDAKGLSH